MWSVELLEQFVLMAGEKIEGEWVLCGASVLPLLGIPSRTTWDIDFFGLKDPKQSELHSLMSLAESLGVAPECINMSGGFYLKKIPNYRENLVLLESGESSKIYIPNLFLFIQMKLQRFTESDKRDCGDYLSFEKKRNPNLNTKEISKHLKQALMNLDHAEKAKRVVQLMQILEN